MLTEFGLKIAPSTYYAALTRPVSKRAVRDEELMEMIDKNLSGELFGVRGAEGVVAVRAGRRPVGRCRVERLMRRMGLAGRCAREDGAHHGPDKDGAGPRTW